MICVRCGRISGRWKRFCKSHENLRFQQIICLTRKTIKPYPTKAESELSQTYRAKYMRNWRKAHPLTLKQRRKDNARSYAGVYLRRGKITKKPCQNCGSPNSQMHHPDYLRPLLIEWFCRPCHISIHECQLNNASAAYVLHHSSE